MRQRAETLAAPLPPLLVDAERIAATVAQGVHGRRRVGTGETFWEFRRYREGDPINAVDWRRSAKSQHIFVRENEWEAAESVYLWRDASSSMNYQSQLAPLSKFERATTLILATCSLLIRGGERISALGDGHVPATGRITLRRLAHEFSEGNLHADNFPTKEPLPAYAQLILVSDFLCTNEEMEEWLKVVEWYGNRRVRGHILQVLDPTELAFPFSGRVEFKDLEEDLDLLIGRSQTLAEAYRNRMAAIKETLTVTARRAGWTYAQHRTDQSPQAALLMLYQALAEQRNTGNPLERPT